MADRPIADSKLEGWKAIAAYLEVSVRTAQDCEKHRGLPVHREGELEKSRVFSHTSELDEWKARRLHPIRDFAPPPSTPAEGPAKVPEFCGEKTTPEVHVVSRRRWLKRAATGAAAVIGLTGLSLAVAKLRTRLHGPPSAYKVDGATLIVTGQEGVELWRHTFSSQMAPVPYETGSRKCIFVDLTGDGTVDTLFFHAPADSVVHRSLVAFDHAGRVRWRFVPGKPIIDNLGHDFLPPFLVECFDVVLGNRPDPCHVIVSSVHQWSYPNQIAMLDGRTGQIISEYWHRGHLTQITIGELKGARNPSVLLAGVNDAPERKQATLVVFDCDKIAGASRDEKGSTHFQGMTAGTEKQVIYFPRTPISKLEEFNHVTEIRIAGGRIMATVVESASPTGPYVVYEFDDSLQLLGVALSGSAWREYLALQNRREILIETNSAVCERLAKSVTVINY